MSQISEIVEKLPVATVEYVATGVTLKEQMVAVPGKDEPAVFALVLASKNADGSWGQHSVLKRFEDDPTCKHPLLANIASLFQLLEFSARVDTSVPQIAALAGYLKATYGKDISGLSLSDVVKLLHPVLDEIVAAQSAATPPKNSP